MYDRMGRWICLPNAPHPCPTVDPGIHPHAEFLDSLVMPQNQERLTWHCPVCGLTFFTYLYTTDIGDHVVWGVDPAWSEEIINDCTDLQEPTAPVRYLAPADRSSKNKYGTGK